MPNQKNRIKTEQKNALKNITNDRGVLSYVLYNYWTYRSITAAHRIYLFNWDDGYSLPIFNEQVIKAVSYDKALLIFKKAHPLTKILAWRCLGRAFTTQEIIDNASTIGSLEKIIIDLSEVVPTDEDEYHETNVNRAYYSDELEKALDEKEQIVKYLSIIRK